MEAKMGSKVGKDEETGFANTFIPADVFGLTKK